MGNVAVADAVHDQIRLLARAWGISEGEVVRRLVEEYLRGGDETIASGSPKDGISVHAIYNGTRIDGRYHSANGKLEITSGVLARQVFKTPSGAAIAVVRAHNPGVKPNRNGWTFWVVTETGKLLQSLR